MSTNQPEMFTKNNAASYVEWPLKINSDTNIAWSDTADVVVVGYGGAGVCTALEAKAQGVDVLAIDRFEGGGATAMSGGIVYGGATTYQKKAGIDDSADEMYKYLKREIGDVVRDETLRRFCEESPDNFSWLESHGLRFGSRLFKGKRSYPPKNHDLYYSGNEAAPSFANIAKSAARGHRVMGDGYTGKDFFQGLHQSAQKSGVRLRTHTLVKRLVIDDNNNVVGVEVLKLPEVSKAIKQHNKILAKVNKLQRFIEPLAMKAAAKARKIEQEYGEILYIKANRGVVLTTGSFSFNREMVRHYAPKYGGALALGTISCDGSGVLLGQSVGGAVGYMDSVTAWRTISPSEEFVKGLVVNNAGKRFIPEDSYLGHLGKAIVDQDKSQAWLVIDASTYWHAYKEVIPKMGDEGYLEFKAPLLINLLINSTRGKTLSVLAKKIGVDAEGLKSEVIAYNKAAQSGDDPLQKKAANLLALGDGPYVAIDISVSNPRCMCPTIPMGGLRVDEDSGKVLAEDNSIVKGLYAAGRAAVGIPSGFYVSGSSLADCVFSGRRAGLNVTQAMDESVA